MEGCTEHHDSLVIQAVVPKIGMSHSAGSNISDPVVRGGFMHGNDQNKQTLIKHVQCAKVLF